MVKGRNIHKHFNKLHVLKGVDIDITEGEFVSIVGDSGAGKTTLLHILGTLEAPTPDENSKLYINDIDIRKLDEISLANFRNKNIGFIFQFHQLLPEFTAFENICIPGYIKKTSTLDLEKKAIELMDFLNLSNKINNKPNELSGGEKQRVAVARALINSPKLILADEPSGNLDSKSANNLYNLFFEIRKNFNHTFIVVTHNMDLAKKSDRILKISDGIIK
jgi:lipoprotein-releasing system ATP-binding protein